MILIIGGAFQGKLAFAEANFALSPEEVSACHGPEIDFSRRCVCHIEEFCRSHPDPVGYFRAHREQWKDSILILEDIFCGVVPMGEENRIWRQNTGLLSQYLSREADRVSRIFSGLEMRLK